MHCKDDHLYSQVYSIIHDKFMFAVSTPKQSSEPQVLHSSPFPSSLLKNVKLSSQCFSGYLSLLRNLHQTVHPNNQSLFGSTLHFGHIVHLGGLARYWPHMVATRLHFLDI